MRRTPLAFLALLLGTTLASPALAAEQAGVSAAVTGTVELTRLAGNVVGHKVASGEDIFLNDEIASGANSGMQVLLLDETVFTIGPESAILIDDFVYDPQTGSGEVSAQVVKGVFRFVTGRVAARNPEAMNVKLPAGSIGIRGTMVGGIVRPDGSATVFLLGAGPLNDLEAKPGAIVVTNAGVSEWIRTPSWGVELFPGEPPRVIKVDRSLIMEVTGKVNDPAGYDKPGSVQITWFEETRSVAEDSGQATAEGARNGRGSLVLVEEGDALTDLLDDAIETIEPFEIAEQPGGRQLATVEQLLAVPSGISSYAGSAALSDGGAYDFDLLLDFDTREVVANFFNIESPSLGFEAASSFASDDFSNGLGGNAAFQMQGSPIFDGVCGEVGCSVDVDAAFFDAASPPQTADHRLVIHDDLGEFPDVAGEAMGTPGVVFEGRYDESPAGDAGSSYG